MVKYDLGISVNYGWHFDDPSCHGKLFFRPLPSAGWEHSERQAGMMFRYRISPSWLSRGVATVGQQDQRYEWVRLAWLASAGHSLGESQPAGSNLHRVSPYCPRLVTARCFLGVALHAYYCTRCGSASGSTDVLGVLCGKNADD